VEFDATQVTFPLILRSREAGDRMTVAGMSGRRKLKDIFIDEKVAQDVRSSCPVLEHDGRILWLAGLRRCNDDQPDEKTRKILRVALLP
jgi:tRNA(Ile)-lysidine synthase